MKKNQLDLIIVISIFIFCLIVWWPTQNLPYHWDSAGFVINSARTLLNNNFNPLIVPDSDFSHPPLLIALLALAWKIFGQTHLTSHIFMMPFLPIYLISAYFFSKKMFNQKVAVITAILCAVTPVVIAEYGVIYIDLPMAALTTFGLSLWFYHKKYFGIIIFTLAALIKLPALGIVAGLIIWHILRKEYKLAAYLTIPFIGFGVWILYHYQIEHWWIARPGRLSNAPRTLPAIIYSVIYVSKKLFIEQGRLLVILAAIIGIFDLFIQKNIKSINQIKINILLLAVSLSIFFVTGEFGSRYGIFLYPLYYSSSVFIVFQFFNIHKIERYFIPSLAVIAIAFLWIWHPKLSASKSYEFKPSEDLSYQDMIRVGQKMSQFAQTRFPNATYYGGFPEIYQLTQPYQGYVKKSLQFQQCNKFAINSNILQIVIFHPYSPMQIQCNAILQQIVVVPLARFEENGKWMELLLVNATESAKIISPSQK